MTTDHQDVPLLAACFFHSTIISADSCVGLAGDILGHTGSNMQHHREHRANSVVITNAMTWVKTNVACITFQIKRGYIYHNIQVYSLQQLYRIIIIEDLLCMLYTSNLCMYYI